MTLATSICDAKSREVTDLARYLAGELEMENLDLGEEVQLKIAPETIESIIKAWAFTQQNARDGGE